MGCKAQLVRKCLFMPALGCFLFFWGVGILSSKVVDTYLGLVSHQGSLVGLCMQCYKSLCAVTTIYGLSKIGIFTF